VVLETGYAEVLGGRPVVAEYPPEGVTTAELETTAHPSLEIPNWVEYWYWPVTSSISWMP
jgi:hypothetical protein